MTEVMWVPCVLEDVSIDTRFFMGGVNYTSPSDTDFEGLFILPLPVMKGSQRLYVSGVRVGVYDANPADYVDRVLCYASNFNDYQLLFDDNTNRNAKGSYTSEFAPVDVSRHEKVIVRLFCVVSAPEGLDISSVQIKCYYQ